ncbi:hypothetical protein [Archangium lansingense]|uniref:Uncharacterized protein n=1 Tax=Archangium lansingense TaxID=2995310 RepID=A0ABT4AAZ7_9BACT|nr:hypothetical protein [Archangium lansinium]MCY1078837.1 hypothetical protein [Archangium lansinium]
MSPQPAIRGFVCRMILDGARALPAETQRRVLPRVPEQTLALIESAPRMGWVPIEESMKLTEPLHAALGTPGFREFLSTQAERMASYPLLQTFFDGSVRLFGLAPQALLKWSPYAWEQSFRDCGRLVYQPRQESAERGRVEMRLEDVPPLLLLEGTFAQALAGAFEMFLRRCNRKGRVELREQGPRATRFVYDISWE